MCGIAGIVGYSEGAPRPDLAELVRIREAMAVRGPDGIGAWTSPDGLAALAHLRLAIIDLSATGAQPMSTSDGVLHVTYNGEIYNYRELRAELAAKGYRFRTQSDTEVLLHLYADRGEDMVHALRGMFAFAIWDDARKELFLARDPFGIKPLYYGDDGRTLRFASQVKALLKGAGVDTAPEPAGSVGFLIWGNVPEPYTLYRGIRSLPAGSWMRVPRGGSARIVRYFDVTEEFRRAEEAHSDPAANTTEILQQAIGDSVRHHLIADVPVGLFLSAGLDSSTVAAYAAQQKMAPLNCLTLGFPEFKGTGKDEVPIAARVAGTFGLRHETRWITRQDFDAQRERIFEAMDQPSTDGVNTYFVARAAAQSGMKVALSGLGGDELFGGYPSFRQVPWIAKWLAFARPLPAAGRMLRRVLAPITSRITSPKYASVLEYGPTHAGAYLLRRALFMPWEIRSRLDPTTVFVGLEKLDVLRSLEETVHPLRNPRTRVAALELSWYMRNQLLRDADWAGMAHSVEIRTPLVDVALFRALLPLIVSERFPTKEDFARSSPQSIPENVLSRAKTGFATPVREWVAGAKTPAQTGRGLRDWALKVLPPQPRTFRAIALVTDAFGGVGGIAKFNRDLLASIAAMPECAQVVALPRLILRQNEPVPDGVRFVKKAAAGKGRYVRVALAEAMKGPVDLVVAGHINLAPLAILLAALKGAPSMLVIHGIDAWKRNHSRMIDPVLRDFSSVVGVSNLTLTRFGGWSRVDAKKFHLLPNCVDAQRFGPGPKPAELAAGLGLTDRTVIMTLGRLANEERYKGFDEILEALPELARELPGISYLICGDGPDRERLEAKARSLGVSDRVIFTGFVPEERKADYYRLADAYVMPSMGEGFGIVFLEAMACGIPAMGSRLDGGREALLEGKLGHLVDPSDRADVIEGVRATLRTARGVVPQGLSYYSREAFAGRAQAIVRETLNGRRRAQRIAAAPTASRP